jgi:hypothetical protein
MYSVCEVTISPHKISLNSQKKYFTAMKIWNRTQLVFICTRQLLTKLRGESIHFAWDFYKISELRHKEYVIFQKWWFHNCLSEKDIRKFRTSLQTLHLAFIVRGVLRAETCRRLNRFPIALRLIHIASIRTGKLHAFCSLSYDRSVASSFCSLSYDRSVASSFCSLSYGRSYEGSLPCRHQPATFRNPESK